MQMFLPAWLALCLLAALAVTSGVRDVMLKVDSRARSQCLDLERLIRVEQKLLISDALLLGVHPDLTKYLITGEDFFLGGLTENYRPFLLSRPGMERIMLLAENGRVLLRLGGPDAADSARPGKGLEAGLIAEILGTASGLAVQEILIRSRHSDPAGGEGRCRRWLLELLQPVIDANGAHRGALIVYFSGSKFMRGIVREAEIAKGSLYVFGEKGTPLNLPRDAGGGVVSAKELWPKLHGGDRGGFRWGGSSYAFAGLPPVRGGASPTAAAGERCFSPAPQPATRWSRNSGNWSSACLCRPGPRLWRHRFA